MNSTKIIRRQAYGMERSDVAPTIFRLCDEVDNLRKELAEAQPDVDAYRKEYKMIVDENQELQQYKCEMEIQIVALREQLAGAQARIVELGDSLYNKDPDLASRTYNITPSWASEE